MSINGVLLALAIFIIISMSIYWGFFEEWTIWTDYTMAWVGEFLSIRLLQFVLVLRFQVEFNFFIYYWDRLTITRVYLSFIYIYGFVLLAGKKTCSEAFNVERRPSLSPFELLLCKFMDIAVGIYFSWNTYPTRCLLWLW